MVPKQDQDKEETCFSQKCTLQKPTNRTALVVIFSCKLSPHILYLAQLYGVSLSLKPDKEVLNFEIKQFDHQVYNGSYQCITNICQCGGGSYIYIHANVTCNVMQDRRYTLGEYIRTVENFDMKSYKCRHFVGLKPYLLHSLCYITDD